MPSVHIGSCPASCRLTLCGGLRRRNSAHSPSTPFEPGQKQSPRYGPVGGLQQAPERSRLGIAAGSPPSGCQRLREPRASLGLRYRIRAVFIHLTGSPSIHIDAFKRVVHSSSRPAKSVVLPHPHMTPEKPHLSSRTGDARHLTKSTDIRGLTACSIPKSLTFSQNMGHLNLIRCSRKISPKDLNTGKYSLISYTYPESCNAAPIPPRSRKISPQPESGDSFGAQHTPEKPHLS